MAMIQCPECGKDISDKASSCPNCGYPIGSTMPIDILEHKENTIGLRKHMKIVFPIIIGIFLIVLLFFILKSFVECEHEYDNGVITKEATCTEEGEKTFTCILCEDTKTESIPVKVHTYKEKVTKESTFDEEGEKTFTCVNCGNSYTEHIPVRDDDVVVTVKNKLNLPQNTNDGRFSDRVEFAFEIMNRTDKAIKGIQGNLTINDLFGEKVLTMHCDFTGNVIPANESIAVDDLGMDINQYMDDHIKLYDMDYSDLKFEYEVTDIVYDDGTSIKEPPKEEVNESKEIIVDVIGKQNLDINYDVGRYSPRVNFTFEVHNNTTRDIKGIQGVLKIKDLFGVDIMSSGLDFTGQIISANDSVTVSEMGFDINQFIDDDVQIYNTELEDLKFEYKVTDIVYADDTEESLQNDSSRAEAGQQEDENGEDSAEADKKDESSDTKSRETASMTSEQAIQWLNGSWDAGDGVIYNFNLQSDGTTVIPAVGDFWSGYSSGTWSCTGNTVIMTGFREETPNMGFGYMDVEFRITKKDENSASIESTVYCSGHEAEVPPQNTTKTMKRR